MAFSIPEGSRGAKKRTSATGRSSTQNSNTNVKRENRHVSSANDKDGCDSGLSSESSTPTIGSPIPRQRKSSSRPINIGSSCLKSNIAPFTATRNECDNSTKVWRSRSISDSPCFVDRSCNRQYISPLRTSRNIQSPSLDSGDEGSLRVDRDTYQHMFQDIVSIKTMLLKLKRVLQESEENGLTRTETLNPFDNSMKNGLFYNLNESNTADVSTSPGSGGSSIVDELADLRRQIVFLQGQVEDRDRTIQVLQFQVSKLQGPNVGDGQTCALTTNHNNVSANTCNAATQTEKTRPVSAGPSLVQALPQEDVMGPLVRWNESWDRYRPALVGEQLTGSRNVRKPTDRIPRIKKSHQEEALQRQNGHTNKLPVDSSSNAKILKLKDTKTIESNSTEQNEVKADGGGGRGEEGPTKPCILTSRKLVSPIHVSRSARTGISVGRSHKT